MSDRRTPLYPTHEAEGARFTEFNGWTMPVEYDGIRSEHATVRAEAGKFDVSHMGEIEIGGPDAEALCQRLTTNDVAALEPGAAQYSMITDATGVIQDDTLVYRLPETDDPPVRGTGDPEAAYLFVPNAGHDAEMVEWWRDHRDEWDLDATVANRTEAYGLVAVQGPSSVALVDTHTGVDLTDLPRFRTRVTRVAGVPALVSRTGYTGEDGVELFVPGDDVVELWTALDCRSCGLGARDTLRLEMGFLLSGQEFDPDSNPRTPYEADVGFTVDLETDFLGRDALARQAESGPEEVLVGIRMVDRGIPRHGYSIADETGTEIGVVTSGTMSPSLEEAIGLGYVPVSLAAAGTEVRVEIRGDRKTATTVDPPFIGGN